MMDEGEEIIEITDEGDPTIELDDQPEVEPYTKFYSTIQAFIKIPAFQIHLRNLQQMNEDDTGPCRANENYRIYVRTTRGFTELGIDVTDAASGADPLTQDSEDLGTSPIKTNPFFSRLSSVTPFSPEQPAPYDQREIRWFGEYSEHGYAERIQQRELDEHLGYIIFKQSPTRVKTAETKKQHTPPGFEFVQDSKEMDYIDVVSPIMHKVVINEERIAHTPDLISSINFPAYSPASDTNIQYKPAYRFYRNKNNPRLIYIVYIFEDSEKNEVEFLIKYDTVKILRLTDMMEQDKEDPLFMHQLRESAKEISGKPFDDALEDITIAIFENFMNTFEAFYISKMPEEGMMVDKSLGAGISAQVNSGNSFKSLVIKRYNKAFKTEKDAQLAINGLIIYGILCKKAGIKRVHSKYFMIKNASGNFIMYSIQKQLSGFAEDYFDNPNITIEEKLKALEEIFNIGNKLEEYNMIRNKANNNNSHSVIQVREDKNPGNYALVEDSWAIMDDNPAYSYFLGQMNPVNYLSLNLWPEAQKHLEAMSRIPIYGNLFFLRYLKSKINKSSLRHYKFINFGAKSRETAKRFDDYLNLFEKYVSLMSESKHLTNWLKSNEDELQAALLSDRYGYYIPDERIKSLPLKDKIQEYVNKMVSKVASVKSKRAEINSIRNSERVKDQFKSGKQTASVILTDEETIGYLSNYDLRYYPTPRDNYCFWHGILANPRLSWTRLITQFTQESAQRLHEEYLAFLESYMGGAANIVNSNIRQNTPNSWVYDDDIPSIMQFLYHRLQRPYNILVLSLTPDGHLIGIYTHFSFSDAGIYSPNRPITIDDPIRDPDILRSIADQQNTLTFYNHINNVSTENNPSDNHWGIVTGTSIDIDAREELSETILNNPQTFENPLKNRKTQKFKIDTTGKNALTLDLRSPIAKIIAEHDFRDRDISTHLLMALIETLLFELNPEHNLTTTISDNFYKIMPYLTKDYTNNRLFSEKNSIHQFSSILFAMMDWFYINWPSMWEHFKNAENSSDLWNQYQANQNLLLSSIGKELANPFKQSKKPNVIFLIQPDVTYSEKTPLFNVWKFWRPNDDRFLSNRQHFILSPEDLNTLLSRSPQAIALYNSARSLQSGHFVSYHRPYDSETRVLSGWWVVNTIPINKSATQHLLTAHQTRQQIPSDSQGNTTLTYQPDEREVSKEKMKVDLSFLRQALNTTSAPHFDTTQYEQEITDPMLSILYSSMEEKPDDVDPKEKNHSYDIRFCLSQHPGHSLPLSPKTVSALPPKPSVKKQFWLLLALSVAQLFKHDYSKKGL